MSIDKGPVIVVGAGPAGLAASYELQRAGVDHIVLERGAVGQSWRDRWDSFCLVTPNWYLQLPGGEYAGEDPDGFMSRDEVVVHLERYAQGFEAPILDRIDVTALCSDPGGGFVMGTSEGQMRTDAVVLATGAFQRPHRPPADLPAGLLVIDADSYTSPDGLPAGGVLVVGSGQTGCQVAEELHRSGRDVTLVCGKAGWAPRRVEGRDIVSWLVETPFLEQAVEDLPSPLARLAANFQTTGRDRGRDLNYRTLLADGVTLTGHLLGAGESTIRFAADLDESVAWGDARYADVCNLLGQAAMNRGALASRACGTGAHESRPTGRDQGARSRGRGVHVGLSPGVPELGAVPSRIRRPRIPDPARWREHRRAGPLLRWDALLAEAEVLHPVRHGGGR